MAIVKTIGLTRCFGKTTAVDHLDLQVEEGEILGLLGPNGAGKTTTLLMLTTVIKPTEGTAIVGGFDIREQPYAVRQLIGIAFQEPKLYWVNTPWEILSWHAKVCRARNRETVVEDLMRKLDLWDARKKFAHELSGGMKKRVEVAKILIQKPKIAIIDEPTAQIDISGKYMIWDMIRSLREDGSTIILATNELSEADRLSDGVAIMHKGRLSICDSPRNLKDSIPGGDVVGMRFERPLIQGALAELKSIEGVVDVAVVTVYASPLLVLTFIILGFPPVASLPVIVSALFMLAMRISGLGISVAATMRSFEKFATARGFLYLILMFCSTVFYPMNLLKGILLGPLVLFAELNPLSSGADLLRGYLIGQPPLTAYVWENLVIFSTGFILVGAFFYSRAIERA